jgi:long-chain fatty acid transport protein
MRKTILTVALFPAMALANADSVPNVNPRDLGMAGSLVAAQEGAPAAFGNPAALSRLRGVDISLAGCLLDNGTEWQNPNFSPSKVSTGFRPAPPVALYAAYGGTLGERGWGVGIGLGIPEGGNENWPADWPGNTRIIEVNRRVYGVYATAGFEVIPQLRIGGGAIYYRHTEYLTQAVSFPNAPQGLAEVSTVGDSFSYDLSAEVTPVPDFPLTLAVDYKHQSVQTLKGDARFHGVPLALRPSLPDQGVTHRFTIPNSLNVGLAVRPVPQLLLSFAWTFDRFSVYPEDRFTGDLGTEVVVPRNYGDGNTYRMGAEYTINPQWQVRAGALRDITGLKKQYFSPSLQDGDVWAGSLGGSFYFGKGFGAHATVFYAHYDDVDTTGLSPAFPGLWKSYAWVYSAGITYHWDPPGSVGKISQP